ncbi:MAG: hypothetical protein Q9217_004758 [Psora testacea]
MGNIIGDSSMLRFPKLKGAINYARWTEDARAIFILREVWDIVDGTEPKPLPPSETKGREPGTPKEGVTIPPSTSEQQEYQLAYKEWKKKNDRGWSIMIGIIEDGPRAHVRGVHSVLAMWMKFKEVYGDDDLATRDNALHKISHLDASKFKSLHDYTTELKVHQARLDSMDKSLPAWVITSFFRMGLGPDLEPYAFQMIQAAKTEHREIDIDEMTTALVEKTGPPPQRDCNIYSNSRLQARLW